MPLPDLCIAPHEAGELAKSEPLCAPATHCIRVWRNWALHTYYVREIKSLRPYFRERKCFAVQRVGDGGTTLFLELIPGEDLTRDLRRWLGKKFKDAFWRRLLYFDDGFRLNTSRTNWKFCLEIFGSYRKAWRMNENLGGEDCNFRLEPDNGRSTYWASIPWDKVKKQIVQSEQDSSCKVGLRWIQHTPQERNEWVFPVRRDTREQHDLLLRSIVWGDDSLDSSNLWEWVIGWSPESGLQIELTSERANRTSNAPETRLLWLMGQYSSRSLCPRQIRLLEIIRQYFGLYLNKVPGAGTANWCRYNGGKILFLQVFPVSHHERLEACLRLREWLSDKVAPEEIPFLLGETV